MEREALEYYLNRSFPVDRMILKRPKSLRESHIKTAASIVYDEIMNGRYVRDIDVAKAVFTKAKEVKSEEFIRNQTTGRRYAIFFLVLACLVSFYFLAYKWAVFINA